MCVHARARACSDESALVVLSNDAYAPVVYLDIRQWHTEAKEAHSGAADAGSAAVAAAPAAHVVPAWRGGGASRRGVADGGTADGGASTVVPAVAGSAASCAGFDDVAVAGLVDAAGCGVGAQVHAILSCAEVLLRGHGCSGLGCVFFVRMYEAAPRAA